MKENLDNLDSNHSTFAQESKNNFQTKEFFWSENLASSLNQLIEKCSTLDNKAFIITDLDETIFFTAIKHYLEMIKYLIQSGYTFDQMSEFPAIQEIFEYGGLIDFLKDFEEYSFLMKVGSDNVKSYHFNRNIPLLNDDSIVEAFEELNDTYPVVAALTGRKDGFTKLCQKELKKNHLPKMPVFCRPKGVGVKDIADWKLHVLKIMANYLNKVLVMVDDSVFLFKKIQEENNPLIKGFIYQAPTINHDYIDDKNLLFTKWSNVKDNIDLKIQNWINKN